MSENKIKEHPDFKNTLIKKITKWSDSSILLSYYLFVLFVLDDF